MTEISDPTVVGAQASVAKSRLVVIGNGMAGARAVEEILDRGGAELFDITMFGDEPHGNYNRISLSNVLAGSEETAGIFLNPLDWYEQNDITLRAGVRVSAIDRYAKTVDADDGSTYGYDKLIIATGSRSFFGVSCCSRGSVKRCVQRGSGGHRPLSESIARAIRASGL